MLDAWQAVSDDEKQHLFQDLRQAIQKGYSQAMSGQSTIWADCYRIR